MAWSLKVIAAWTHFVRRLLGFKRPRRSLGRRLRRYPGNGWVGTREHMVWLSSDDNPDVDPDVSYHHHILFLSSDDEE